MRSQLTDSDMRMRALCHQRMRIVQTGRTSTSKLSRPTWTTGCTSSYALAMRCPVLTYIVLVLMSYRVCYEMCPMSGVDVGPLPGFGGWGIAAEQQTVRQNRGPGLDSLQCAIACNKAQSPYSSDQECRILWF
eukprot:137562-Rhodomonas_salina.3